MKDDRRIIEDYLPIEDISGEASGEKSLRKGNISTLHLWWARRPLTACRAAVFGTLVPVSRFRTINGSESKRASLARTNGARFIKALCTFPGLQTVLSEGEQHILGAHAERLSEETGEVVTVEDIKAGKAPRPRVLDIFAGGGAIPLEALRLGCEAYALDLNPVAHIIETATLVYPQKYGKPESAAKGCDPSGKWAGLAKEVSHWGSWVLKRVSSEIADLYPPLPNPNLKGTKESRSGHLWTQGTSSENPNGKLLPIAYLWTRTVTCKNPSCAATVPLARQHWLCKKDQRLVALKAVISKRQITFAIVESSTVKGLGFDPDEGSQGGNATCRCCGTVADIDYVRDEANAARMGDQLLAAICTSVGARGKTYVAADAALAFVPTTDSVRARLKALCESTGLQIPSEPIEANPRSMDTQHFGFRRWADLFPPRPLLALMTTAATIIAADKEMSALGYDRDRAMAVTTFLATALDREAEDLSSLCRWNATAEKMQGTFGRQALPMVWDYCEINPFGGSVGDWNSLIDLEVNGIEACDAFRGNPAHVSRGSATALNWPAEYFDAVITDPPYYDNVSYSNLSDFFYVWLKLSVGHLYPEHFAASATPKKNEIIAAAYRHGGDKKKSRDAYERMMAEAFREANRVLKPGAPLVVVYAHKTTLGWATLVDALRVAGFMVTEAWPLDTEMKSRLVAMETASLASSIFLVGRKRSAQTTGRYEIDVRPELENIVRERVSSLWDIGVSGADLVIACLGAGLRAFTRYARVEYANGEEVPAERFLTEVETVVLESILGRLSEAVEGSAGSHSLTGLDAPSRFYTLWRYTYRSTDLEAGEAIIFANGTHVELDGLHGLSQGSRPLVEKRKGKYRLLDYSERGDEATLGLPSENGEGAPLVDALHRLLWLMERHPSGIPDFLREARPSTEQLRLIAQALAGPALKGGELGEVATGSELTALTKLTANWRSVVEDVVEAMEGPLFKASKHRE